MADAALAGVTFRAPLMLLADGLGATIDDFVYHREVAVAAEAFDVKAGRIEAGTVSAQRFGYTAIVDGRRGADRRAHHPPRRRPGAGLADRARAGR